MCCPWWARGRAAMGVVKPMPASPPCPRGGAPAGRAWGRGRAIGFWSLCACASGVPAGAASAPAAPCSCRLAGEAVAPGLAAFKRGPSPASVPPLCACASGPPQPRQCPQPRRARSRQPIALPLPPCPACMRPAICRHCCRCLVQACPDAEPLPPTLSACRPPNAVCVLSVRCLSAACLPTARPPNAVCLPACCLLRPDVWSTVCLPTAARPRHS